MEKLYKYVSYEELLLAYYDCRKHKRNTKEAIEFELNRYKNLYKLLKELNNGTYTIGVSKCFIVTKPVIREVFAASFRDRIVHHLIINRINIIFENEVMSDKAFACRKGKGTLYGIKQLVLDIKTVSQNYKKETFVFKGDFKSFFMIITCLAIIVHVYLYKSANYLQKSATASAALSISSMIPLSQRDARFGSNGTRPRKGIP